jgi:hypothetical protein
LRGFSLTKESGQEVHWCHDLHPLVVHGVGAPLVFAAVTAHLYGRSGGGRPIFIAAVLVSGASRLAMMGGHLIRKTQGRETFSARQ